MSTPDLALPRPPFNRLLVFVPPTAGMAMRGGLHVVQSATEAPLQGHVLAVGPDVVSAVTHNRVLFSKYAGVTAEIGGREYHVIEESDILLVWPEVFELPDELHAPAVPAEMLEDGPCTCDPADINVAAPCGSSSCIQFGYDAAEVSDAEEVSPLVDDATRRVELISG